jgi:hemerythrin superfamily protein
MADGFAILEDAHRSIEQQFEQYFHDNEEPIARTICDALSEHAAVEEVVLYPRLRRDVPGGDELADTADNEHAIMKALVARIVDSPPESIFDLMTELRRDVGAHVRFEESEIFVRMRDARVDAERLGDDLARAESHHLSR